MDVDGEGPADEWLQLPTAHHGSTDINAIDNGPVVGSLQSLTSQIPRYTAEKISATDHSFGCRLLSILGLPPLSAFFLSFFLFLCTAVDIIVYAKFADWL